jgi:hypothetical protein
MLRCAAPLLLLLVLPGCGAPARLCDVPPCVTQGASPCAVSSVAGERPATVAHLRVAGRSS